MEEKRNGESVKKREGMLRKMGREKKVQEGEVEKRTNEKWGE